MNYNCLIIDDEISLAQSTCEYFNMFNVKSAYVTDSADALKFLENNSTDLILLDINLKNESGFELCKNLRKSTNIPILFISARQSDEDVLIALNIGGDDYIKKPYSLSVLLAKVNAVLKRYKGNISNNLILVFKNIKIDIEAMQVFKDEIDVKLKTMEFKLLKYLIMNKNKVISKEELFANVWGDSFFSDGTLNVHIRKIREKIEDNPNDPKLIKTIWGTGYMFEANEK